MNELYSEDQKPKVAQTDINTWHILKKALRAGLSDRGIFVGDDEASFITRFFLEGIERRGLRVVPVRPTSVMHLAMRQALDVGKRMTVSWVGWRAKQLWRYVAAIDAAPSWKRGYEQDQKQAEGKSDS